MTKSVNGQLFMGAHKKITWLKVASTFIDIWTKIFIVYTFCNFLSLNGNCPKQTLTPPNFTFNPTDFVLIPGIAIQCYVKNGFINIFSSSFNTY